MKEIRFGSRKRGKRRAAVLALEGSSPHELRRALALGHSFDSKPVLIAVDGGLATFRTVRRRPDLFVGDLDSARRAPDGIPACIYPVAKDFSDFAGALRQARKLEADVVVVAGFLGGRLDHEWANVLEAAAAARGFDGLIATAERALVVVTAGSVRARTAPRQSFSIFALNLGTRVTLKGASWKLDRDRLPPGSLGLSNVTRNRVALTVHQGVVAMVIPTEG